MKKVTLLVLIFSFPSIFNFAFIHSSKFGFETCSAQIVSLGKGFSHAVCNDGTVWAWGLDNAGQLGDDVTLLSQPIPIPISSLSNFISVSSGISFTVALKSDGTVWSWGTDGNGELGDDASLTDSPIPVMVASLTDIIAIAAGGDHCLALKSDGTVYAWGNDNEGQLGDGASTDQPTPIAVSSLSDIVAIAAGINHSMALKNDGTVYTWGQDNTGQLGDDVSLVDQSTPVLNTYLSNIVQIAAGWNHSIALRSDGSVYTWGSDINGALGDDIVSLDQPIPVVVSGISNVVSIGAGGLHTIVLKSDGTVWTWGDDFYGQLGDDLTLADQYTPVQVLGLTDINFIASGKSYHNVAVKIDGTVWTWGSDQHGELGDDAPLVSQATPVQVNTSLCAGMPLPISLLYFNANLLANNNVLLTWSTANEQNNNYFSVERSEDGIHFYTIGSIKGAGNSTKTLKYSFIDKKPLTSRAYYRLLQTDYDAKKSVSNIVTVQSHNKAEMLKIHVYNTANKSSFESFDISPNSNIIISDLLGKIIYNQCMSEENYSIDLSSFTSGVYLMQMQAVNGEQAKLILVTN